MSVKPIRTKELASDDIAKAISFLLEEDAKQAAMGFINALQKVNELVSFQPSAGSSRYAHELDLPNLRSWPLQRYPYVLFYMERSDHIEVWRVLHMSRDIPASLFRPVTTPH